MDGWMEGWCIQQWNWLNAVDPCICVTKFLVEIDHESQSVANLFTFFRDPNMRPIYSTHNSSSQHSLAVRIAWQTQTMPGSSIFTCTNFTISRNKSFVWLFATMLNMFAGCVRYGVLCWVCVCVWLPMSMMLQLHSSWRAHCNNHKMFNGKLIVVCGFMDGSKAFYAVIIVTVLCSWQAYGHTFSRDLYICTCELEWVCEQVSECELKRKGLMINVDIQSHCNGANANN